MSLKKDFVWGAGTSAFQVEGAARIDGKGLSIWDTYCENLGMMFGDTACDQYHRYKEDVKLMSEIGLKAYRFSTSWARVIPYGDGKINEKGLDYYDRLVDELLGKDIEPYLTLFHWDFPYELYKKGHWLNTDCIKWFEEYAYIMARRLGDRVKNWITINEPQCFIGLGLQDGKIAPGHRHNNRDIITMIHNVLLSHGRSVKVIRETCKSDVKVGYAPVARIYIPETDSKEDLEAARKATFTTTIDENGKIDLWENSIWMDPIYKGKYPEIIVQKFEKLLPKSYEDDMKIISEELDFLACNVYTGFTVKSDGRGSFERSKGKNNKATTANGWSVTPEALYWGPRMFYEEYNKPILVAENGLCLSDWILEDKIINDVNRIDFIKQYLRQLKRATNDGVEIDGYFYWSLLDNLEWEKGLKTRFGLIYVDFDTQERYLKNSALWFKQLIESNGEII